MKTSRGCRRVGTLCLVGLLVMIIVVFPPVGDAARLATEETPTTRRAAPRGAAPAASQAGQRDARGGADGTIHLNFRNADMLQIINLMSELTGKNFLVDDKVRGKVTIIAPKPVTLDEAYQVFLSVLEIQGFTVVPQGPITKIIPSRDVKDNPIPTATDAQRRFSPATDSFVTQLIPLQYADANDIRGLLTPLVSKESSLLSYAPTNSLIVTDTASNIDRLLKIIAALDVEGPTAMFKVVSLKHAQAEQMANALRSVIEGLGGGSDTGTEAAPQPGQPAPPAAPRARRAAQVSAGQRTQRGPRVIPDARTNSLVLIATRPDMATIEDVIVKLDVPTPEGRGQIHVYSLQYANAEELAQVLTAQAGEIARTLAGPVAGEAQQRPGMPPTTPGTFPPTTPPVGTTQQRRQGVVSGTTPSGISIVADRSTNSLVITAPPEAYAILREIIQKLDVRRAQVLVESLIAEVTLNRAQTLGVEWRALNSPDGTQVFASSAGSGQTGLINSTLGPITGIGTGAGAGAANPLLGLTTPGFLIGLLNTLRIQDPNNPNNVTQILNIPFLLRAFQGDSDVNILSTPNLLTTDNEEAEIVIGENRPFLRSAQDTPVGGTVTGSSTIRTFEFKDVGITLRITPQISQGKTVRLKLAQEVSAFVSETELGAPRTTKRSTKTTVIVDDNQTIVIGGLIRDDTNEAKTQVPCLGNLPIFGWAFRQTSASKTKTNLLIFLTPHIITSPEDIDRVTTHERKRSEQAPAIEERLREGQPQDNLELLLN